MAFFGLFVSPREFNDAVEKILAAINAKGKAIMATLEEVKDAIGAVKTAAEEAATKSGEAVTEIGEAVVIIGEIKDKLDELQAGGNGATPEQLQELVDLLAPVPQSLTDASTALGTAKDALDDAGNAADITP